MDTRPGIRDFLELTQQERDVRLWKKEVHLPNVAAEALFDIWKDPWARLDFVNRLRDCGEHPAVRGHILDVGSDHHAK